MTLGSDERRDIAMGSRFQTSTGAMMVLVSVVALELVMFRGVLEIVLYPPIAIVLLAFNLGLFYLLARPRNLQTRIIGMIWGGAAAFWGLVAYQALGNQGPPGPGLIGSLVNATLESWAMSQKDQKGSGATTLRWLSSNAIWLEYAILYTLGIWVIWSGGQVQDRLRARWARTRATEAPEALPLDDRGLTPL
jgi:hypothetical protein